MSDQLERQLARELIVRAETIPGTVSLAGPARARARHIQVRRRFLTAFGCVAAVAVAVPVGLGISGELNLAPAPANTPPAPARLTSNGVIAFVPDNSEFERLEAYDPQAPDERPVELLESPNLVPSMTWSPDGTKIAYVHTTVTGIADASGIKVVDLATQHVQEIECPDVPFHICWMGSELAWSPDDSRLAYTGLHSLSMISVATGQATLVAAMPIYSPSWSAEGDRIVYATRQQTGHSSLKILAVDGGKPVFQGQLGVAPAWSPDGERIAFIQGCSVWLTNATNDYRRLLVQIPDCPPSPRELRGGVPWSPRSSLEWSPDSEQLLIDGTYLVLADGSDLSALPREIGGAPKWQPVE